MLECVINISEGERPALVREIAAEALDDLLDLHVDADHNRSVLTVVGEQAPRAVAAAAVDRLDLRRHAGAHPRIGVVDVVPFVALEGSSEADAVAARDRFSSWAADELALPSFLYGPLPGGLHRTLPEIRRGAFDTIAPDAGPAEPHPSAGAVAVGARPVLVAYNLWLESTDLGVAQRIAREVRSGSVRALGLQVGDRVQVSMNLIDPATTGPAEVWDAVATHARIERAELVGLAPASLLDATPPGRWETLDLAPDRTIEARIAAHGG